MQPLNIKPGLLTPIVQVPPSKSYANRALILAALKPGEVTLQNMPQALDVTLLIKCLKEVGLHIREQGDDVTVVNSFPACERNQAVALEVGEGGTTARFLASLLITGKTPYILILGKRLKQRPWQEFIQLVNQLGGKAHLQDEKLFLQGPLDVPSSLAVDCTATTQFASGFQLALAFKEVLITPVNLKSSLSYWEMTKALIAHFQQQDSFCIPRDWSSASYPLAFAAIRQEITFPGLRPDSFQADSKFFDILQQIGSLIESADGLKVIPTTFKGNLKLEASDCLDLVPALSFLLANIDGSHQIKGIENLVHKESDRLNEIIKLLKSFEYKAWSDSSSLYIEGASGRRVAERKLVLPDDHRMVMTATLFLLSHQGGSLTPAQAVAKSYPSFFSLLQNH